MFNLYNPMITINIPLFKTWKLSHKGVKQFPQGPKLVSNTNKIHSDLRG